MKSRKVGSQLEHKEIRSRIKVSPDILMMGKGDKFMVGSRFRVGM